MVNINLLPVNQRHKQTSSADKGWMVAGVVVGLATLLAVLGLEFYYNSQVGGLKTQLASLEGEIAALEPAKTEHDQLTNRKLELESVTSVARKLRDEKTYWSNDLAAFTAQLPADKNVAINTLKMAETKDQIVEMKQGGLAEGSVLKRTMSVEGIANSQKSVIDVLNSFESSGNFGVVFKDMKLAEQDNGAEMYNFSVDIGIAKEGTANDATVTADSATPATSTPTTGGTN